MGRAHRIGVTSLILVVGCALLIAARSSAQINLQLGAGLGFMVAAGDYNGTTADYYNGTKYGFSNGYTVFARARAGVLGFTVMGEAGYASISAHGTIDDVSQGNVNIGQKILMLKIGPEFQLVSVPLAPIKPYVGVNIAMNSFRGDATFTGTALVPDGTYTMPHASRTGLGLTAGTLVSISPGEQLDFCITYNLMNISGKTWSPDDPTRRSGTYSALNDAADPQYASGSAVHIVGSDRSIHTLMFTASILFGL